MFRKALATYGLTISVAALCLMAPPAIEAQLPDAPSAVKIRRISEAAGTSETSAAASAGLELEDSLSSSRGSPSLPRTGFWKNLHFNFAPTFIAPPVELALNIEYPEGPQESLYRPSKQTALPGLSSGIAETRPVPGAAPALYSPCPKDTCPLAQTTMCCVLSPSPFRRYLKNPDTVVWTARNNLHLAVMHVIDPFNLGTIVVDAAIGVASNSDSAYGPGLLGVAKYSGVSLTEDMTGEFFGTFLVPSLVHQDPRYHRVPYVSVKRRLLHAVTAVVWSQSYTGKPMLNYGNIFGGIATAAVSNTFVPGPNRQGFSNTAQRLALAFAISPTGNLVSEFFPDVANRINLRVVIFQRILNSVSIEESGVP